MSVFKLESMSTNESDVEDGEEVLVVHPLPWLSETVCELKRAGLLINKLECPKPVRLNDK